MFGKGALPQRGRVVRSNWNGHSSINGLMMDSVSMYIQEPIPLMVDVDTSGRIVTICVYRNEKCSVISEKLELDVDQCYLMLGGKPLQWGRCLGDYDVGARCTVQVLATLGGGGLIFFTLCAFVPYFTWGKKFFFLNSLLYLYVNSLFHGFQLSSLLYRASTISIGFHWLLWKRSLLFKKILKKK